MAGSLNHRGGRQFIVKKKIKNKILKIILKKEECYTPIAAGSYSRQL
jgi:hypothetical protein